MRSKKVFASFQILSRFPLYLLLHFVPQKDAAAIGANQTDNSLFLMDEFFAISFLQSAVSRSFINHHLSMMKKMVVRQNHRTCNHQIRQCKRY